MPQHHHAQKTRVNSEHVGSGHAGNGAQRFRNSPRRRRHGRRFSLDPVMPYIAAAHARRGGPEGDLWRDMGVSPPKRDYVAERTIEKICKYLGVHVWNLYDEYEEEVVHSETV